MERRYNGLKDEKEYSGADNSGKISKFLSLSKLSGKMEFRGIIESWLEENRSSTS